MAAETPPTCSICEGRAVFLNRETRTHLCSTHLQESVETRVLNRIRTSSDLPGTIGIAFSGGKDSTALLAAVVALKDKIPARLIALTVDEGIRGYREETISHAKEVCRRLGVEHRIISFTELYGSSLDDLMAEPSRKACTICGILRRRALEVLAERLSVNLIATGHNQDDHAQTTLMNAFSADIKKVFAGTGRRERFARRIKPFAAVSEREASLYAILAGLFRDLPECPYAGDSLRGEVRRLLTGFEQDYPGTMRNTAKIEENLRKDLKPNISLIPMITCRECGWPGSGDICQVCSLLGPDWIRKGDNSGTPVS
ncbi:MAG TPA: TIGR00269 family protein [Methanospirillum sp.]|nr:TIGR00269 family protein [Methanospirillum sp.]